MMQANNPWAGQFGGWSCGCSSPSQCQSLACPRRQQAARDINDYRQGLGDLGGFYNRATPVVDLERFADLIVERLKRPEGYQG